MMFAGEKYCSESAVSRGFSALVALSMEEHRLLWLAAYARGALPIATGSAISPRMIVCSCNVISKSCLEEAAEKLAAADPTRPLTPGRIFQAIGKRPDCGTCARTIRQIIADGGHRFTCPEPLASVAEAPPTATRMIDFSEITEIEIIRETVERIIIKV